MTKISLTRKHFPRQQTQALQSQNTLFPPKNLIVSIPSLFYWNQNLKRGVKSDFLVTS